MPVYSSVSLERWERGTPQGSTNVLNPRQLFRSVCTILCCRSLFNRPIFIVVCLDIERSEAVNHLNAVLPLTVTHSRLLVSKGLSP